MKNEGSGRKGTGECRQPPGRQRQDFADSVLEVAAFKTDKIVNNGLLFGNRQQLVGVAAMLDENPGILKVARTLLTQMNERVTSDVRMPIIGRRDQRGEHIKTC